MSKKQVKSPSIFSRPLHPPKAGVGGVTDSHLFRSHLVSLLKVHIIVSCKFPVIAFIVSFKVQLFRSTTPLD